MGLLTRTGPANSTGADPGQQGERPDRQPAAGDATAEALAPTLESFLAALPDAAFVADRGYRLVFANRGFLHWLGELAPRTNVVGSLLFDVLPLPEDRVRRQYDPVFAQNETLRTTERYAFAAADTVTQTTRIPICVGGEVALAVSLIRDLSESNQLDFLLSAQRDLALALSSIRGLEEGLRLCLDTAFRVSGLDSGGVYLRDRAHGGLKLVYHAGLSQDFVRVTSYFPADCGQTRLVQEGKARYTKHEELGFAFDDARRAENLRAVAVVPICHDGEAIGCLNMASLHLTEVTSYARHALETIAAQIGGAVVRLQAEEERRALALQLEDALEKNTILHGVIPICAECKRIRDSDGEWQQLEAYMHHHAETQFSHGLCPQCAQRITTEFDKGKNR